MPSGTLLILRSRCLVIVPAVIEKTGHKRGTTPSPDIFLIHHAASRRAGRDTGMRPPPILFSHVTSHGRGFYPFCASLSTVAPCLHLIPTRRASALRRSIQANRGKQICLPSGLDKRWRLARLALLDPCVRAMPVPCVAPPLIEPCATARKGGSPSPSADRHDHQTAHESV